MQNYQNQSSKHLAYELNKIPSDIRRGDSKEEAILFNPDSPDEQEGGVKPEEVEPFQNQFQDINDSKIKQKKKQDEGTQGSEEATSLEENKAYKICSVKLQL